MSKCSKCGEESMSFTCRYCGKKFCATHRLPENHDCEKMGEEVEREREETDKWFQEKDVREDLKPGKSSRPAKPSVLKDALGALKGSATLAIIAVTSMAFLAQGMSISFTEILLLDPSTDALLQKPWTLLTVMIVHGSFFHLFANMITFYFFGTPLERIMGSKDLLKFYIGSGLAASLGYVLFRNLLFQLYGPTLGGIPTLGAAVGASGAVVAIFAAVAILYPEAEVLLYFFIPMKIKTALYLFGGVEGVNLLAKSVGVTLPLIGNFASSAHLTGLLVGVWYGRKLREKHRTKTGVLDLLGY